MRRRGPSAPVAGPSHAREFEHDTSFSPFLSRVFEGGCRSRRTRIAAPPGSVSRPRETARRRRKDETMLRMFGVMSKASPRTLIALLMLLCLGSFSARALAADPVTVYEEVKDKD